MECSFVSLTLWGGLRAVGEVSGLCLPPKEDGKSVHPVSRRRTTESFSETQRDSFRGVAGTYLPRSTVGTGIF